MTITYTETLELDTKDIFLLQVMNRLVDQEMMYSGDYDWMHREKVKDYYGPRIERDSTDKTFRKLIDLGLLKRSDSGIPDTYFRYKISAKGNTILVQILNVDTSEYEYLIPEGFRKKCYIKPLCNVSK